MEVKNFERHGFCIKIIQVCVLWNNSVMCGVHLLLKLIVPYLYQKEIMCRKVLGQYD